MKVDVSGSGVAMAWHPGVAAAAAVAAAVVLSLLQGAVQCSTVRCCAEVCDVGFGGGGN